MLNKTYTKINELKAALDEEFTTTINEKTADLKAQAEKEVKDRFLRDLDTLAQFTVLSEGSPNLSGLSKAQVVSSVQGNNKQAAVTLALVDYFRQNPTNTGTDLADLGISIPVGLNINTIKNVAQASMIYDKLNAARPRLSIGIMALSGKA